MYIVHVCSVLAIRSFCRTLTVLYMYMYIHVQSVSAHVLRGGGVGGAQPITTTVYTPPPPPPPPPPPTTIHHYHVSPPPHPSPLLVLREGGTLMVLAGNVCSSLISVCDLHVCVPYSEDACPNVGSAQLAGLCARPATVSSTREKVWASFAILFSPLGSS